jgi:hypothetical protein
VAPPAHGLTVVVVARDHRPGLGGGAPLAAALVDWNRERTVTVSRIQLRRFDLEDCRALLKVMFSVDELSDEFAQAIYGETEGNPFFIEEVIKALIEDGQIYRQDGSWERIQIEKLGIPQSVKEAVGRRLDRLSPQGIGTLQHAAMWQVFEFAELVAFVETPEDQLVDTLDEALAAQLIQPGSGETFAFTHDKIREVLYDELNSIRRRRLHQRLAETLERLYSGPALEAHVQELAHHFLHAGDLQKGLQYATLAAQKAAQVYAYDDPVPSALRLSAPRLDLRAVGDRGGQPETHMQAGCSTWLRRATAGLKHGCTGQAGRRQWIRSGCEIRAALKNNRDVRPGGR